MIGYAIDVDTRELTRALKRLLRTEKKAPLVYLRFVPGKLTISLGHTSEDLLVGGGPWPGLVSADARWVTALATAPLKVSVTDLRVHDGKLSARDFVVLCTVHEAQAVAGDALAEKKVKRADT